MANLARIHFVSLIKPENDLDLLENFASHYSDLDPDTKTVFLHESDDLEAFEVACDILTDYAFKILPINKNLAFDGGNLRGKVLEAYRKSLPDEDYIWTADADEFQIFPGPIRDLLHLVESYPAHTLEGNLVDCFDHVLHDLEPGEELIESFPYCHDNLYHHIFERPHLQHKVIASKVYLPVDFNGSHKIFPMKTSVQAFRATDGIDIMHYRWRKCMIEKFKKEKYLNQGPGFLDRLQEFFKG